MNEKKGFTILEVMVSLAIFSIVAAAAMSFYKFQTRESAVSSRKKIAQEAATLALMRLKKDVIAAGLGVSEPLLGREDLALYVLDGGGAQAPDELYVSSAPHVDLDLTPTRPDGDGTERQPYAFFPYGSAKPGEDKTWFTLAAGAKELKMSDVNFSVDQRSLGALIIRNGADRYKSRANDSSFTISTTDEADLSPKQKEKGRHDVTFEWTSGVAGGEEAAPAVRYWLNTAQDASSARPHQNRGSLMRNDVALVGAQTTVAGFKADSLAPLMKVTDFQVRCLFDDGNWSPDSVTFGDPNYGPANLRYVEVMVRYIIRSGDIATGGYLTPDDVKDPQFRIVGDTTKGRWMIGGTVVLRATPRNIVLTRYLGGGE
ncbi:MAG: type II secretion system protein [Desulfomonilaceae bacterium]|nr:type II secretion system protein [Desulfomonilaceae bacterium]